MIRNRLIFEALLVGVFAAALAQAEPISLVCPETLDVAETAATPATGDWQVNVSSSPHAFSRLSIYDGKPNGQAALNPDNGDEKTTMYRWILGDVAANLWVECSYKKTTAAVVRNLPKGLHVCNAFVKETTTSLTCE